MFVRHESRARTVDEELDRDLLEEVPEDADEIVNAQDGGGDEDEVGASQNGRLNRPTAGIDAAEVVTALNSAMLKAKNHMLDSMVASYVALLLGCLVHSDEVGFFLCHIQQPLNLAVPRRAATRLAANKKLFYYARAADTLQPICVHHEAR